MANEAIKDAERRMERAVEAAGHDFSTIRTGRANPLMLENIKIDYYGTPTPLSQVAGISVPEPRQLLIAPWDKATVDPIFKAIISSDLNLTPMSDGHVLRINVPPLNEERRKDLIKQLHKKSEDHKVAVRNVRRDVIEHLKAREKKGEIREDELKRAQDEIQKSTDKFIVEIEKLTSAKESELREV